MTGQPMPSEESFENIGVCVIPSHVAGRSDLTSSQKMIYGRIFGLTGKRGYCWASNRWIGSQLGMTPENVSKLIGELQKKGLLVVDVVRDPKTNEVKERKIYLKMDDREDTPSPLKQGGPPPKLKLGRSQIKIGDHISKDFSLENTNNQISLPTDQMESFPGSSPDGPVDPPLQRSVRPRSTPVPTRTVPLPQDPVEPEQQRPSLAAGINIMKHNGEGLWKLLRLVRNVPKMPSGRPYWFQQTTIADKMVTEQGLEENRILEVISWLYKHHADEYVPKFYDATEFSRKFFKLEEAMLRAKQPHGNGRRGWEHLPNGDRILRDDRSAKHVVGYHVPANGGGEYGPHRTVTI